MADNPEPVEEVSQEEYDATDGIELTEVQQLSTLTLGGQLRHLRLMLGWTQERTARFFGIHQGRLSKYERDVQEPRARRFVYMRAQMIQMLEELAQYS